EPVRLPQSVHDSRKSLIVLFVNDTPSTKSYTLSLHDRSSDLFGQDGLALFQITVQLVFAVDQRKAPQVFDAFHQTRLKGIQVVLDRKSTRLNSSHVKISYAVFCLKKKNEEHRLCTYCDGDGET